MKLVEFTYTKADGSTSQRAVLEVVQPTKFFEGVDVSQMPEDQFAEFTKEYRELFENYQNDKMIIMQKYDLKHNYRRFTPEKMSDVIADYI